MKKLLLYKLFIRPTTKINNIIGILSLTFISACLLLFSPLRTERYDIYATEAWLFFILSFFVLLFLLCVFSGLSFLIRDIILKRSYPYFFVLHSWSWGICVLCLTSPFWNSSGECVSGNCDNGYGTFIFDQKKSDEYNLSKETLEFLQKEPLIINQYIGEWKNRQPNGKGKAIYTNQMTHEGQWKNGKFIGE
ncbi:hypothetical protein OAJ56_01140 [Flavobacteriales bacterium]|nr:hypothetical protein [Flavobacteriales bacterium]